MVYAAVDILAKGRRYFFCGTREEELPDQFSRYVSGVRGKPFATEIDRIQI